MINALTIDVEDYFHVQAFADTIRPSEWCQYPLRVENNTFRLLALLEKHGIKATFFVLGWVAERCPNLVRDIFKSGHEIGSHGYNHQMIGQADEQHFQEDSYRAKSILENLLGIPIKSYRAPSYSITTKTLWALKVLHDLGFEHDSSIFPVYHDQYGIPNAPRFPHYQLLQDGSRISEFPPSTLAACRVNIPVGGGGYFRLFPYKFTAWAIRRINERENQPAMIYLHPWEIDPDQPRIAASRRSCFRHYQNLRTTERKLSQLLEEFSWAPMSQVLANRLSTNLAPNEVGNGL